MHAHATAVPVTRSRFRARETLPDYPRPERELRQLANGEGVSGSRLVPEHRLFPRKNNTYQVGNETEIARLFQVPIFRTEKNIGVYKGSACCDKKAIGATFMIFDELSKLGTNCKVRCCTAVTQTTVSDSPSPHSGSQLFFFECAEFQVALICGPNESVTSNDKHINIDDWLSFYWESGLKLDRLKSAITDIVLKKVQCPNWALTDAEESVLVALKRVLMDEEEASGFKQPECVGQPPIERVFRHKPSNNHHIQQNGHRNRPRR